MKLSKKILVVGALFALGFSAEFARKSLESAERKAARPPARGDRGGEMSESFARPFEASAAKAKPASKGEAPASPSEPSAFSLERVRTLWVTEPARALEEAETLLQEARGGEERAELRLIMARSLVSLERFEEARELARKMVLEAPESPFTQDAERHLLVHPFGLPSREEVALRDSVAGR